MTAVENQPQQLLSLPGGIIVVSVSVSANQLQLTIHNGTSVNLPAVQDNAGFAPTSPSPMLAANGDTTVTLGAPTSPNQTHIQIFPSGSAFPDVVTLIVSSEQQAVGASVVSVVGQAFAGGA